MWPIAWPKQARETSGRSGRWTRQEYRVFSTFISGCCGESGNANAIHSPDVFLTGFTASFDFPVTPDATQKSCVPCLRGDLEFGAVVTALNPSLAADKQLVYSTFLAGNSTVLGNGIASGSGIALDTSGDFYVAGMTQGASFYTTSNAFQTDCYASCDESGQNGFVAMFSAPAGVATSTPTTTPTSTPTPKRTPPILTHIPTPTRTPTHISRTPTPTRQDRDP